MRTSTSFQRATRTQRVDGKYISPRKASVTKPHGDLVQAGHQSNRRVQIKPSLMNGQKSDFPVTLEEVRSAALHKSPTALPPRPRNGYGISFTPTRPLSKLIAAPTLFEQPKGTKTQPDLGITKLGISTITTAELEPLGEDIGTLDSKPYEEQSSERTDSLARNPYSPRQTPTREVTLSSSDGSEDPKLLNIIDPKALCHKSPKLEGLGVFLSSNSAQEGSKIKHSSMSRPQENGDAKGVPLEQNKGNEKLRVSSSSSKSSFSKFVSKAMDGRFSTNSCQVDDGQLSTQRISGLRSNHGSTRDESNSIGESQWEKIDWVGELPVDEKKDWRRPKRKREYILSLSFIAQSYSYLLLATPLDLVNPYHKDRSLSIVSNSPMEADSKKYISSPLLSPFLGFSSSGVSSSPASSSALYGHQAHRGFFARLFDWKSPVHFSPSSGANKYLTFLADAVCCITNDNRGRSEGMRRFPYTSQHLLHRNGKR
jgi:hypothetical protein